MRLPAGTGFLVRHGASLYLISARHVVETVETLHARVRPSGSDGEAVLLLTIPRTAWFWVEAESEKMEGRRIRVVDLAVAKLSWPDHQVEVLRNCPKGCPPDVSDFAESDPVPLDPVILCGFPERLGLELALPRPLLRRGMIAMNSDEPFIRYRDDGSYAAPSMVVVDVTSLPGNSGSPIFRQEAGELRLVAMLSGNDDSLALAYAVPVSQINALLSAAAARTIQAGTVWKLEKAPRAE